MGELHNVPSDLLGGSPVHRLKENSMFINIYFSTYLQFELSPPVRLFICAGSGRDRVEEGNGHLKRDAKKPGHLSEPEPA
jgi:hypothetical protein